MGVLICRFAEAAAPGASNDLLALNHKLIMRTESDVLEANAWPVFYKAASSARMSAFFYEGVGNLEFKRVLPLGSLGNIF